VRVAATARQELALVGVACRHARHREREREEEEEEEEQRFSLIKTERIG
jgi:hypothetical protein